MAKLGRELDLTTEALGPEDEAELREEHFDRDLSMEPEVARQINRSHCPVTDFVLDLVVVSDGDFQAVERGRHAEGKGMAARGCEVVLAGQLYGCFSGAARHYRSVGVHRDAQAILRTEAGGH